MNKIATGKKNIAGKVLTTYNSKKIKNSLAIASQQLTSKSHFEQKSQE